MLLDLAMSAMSAAEFVLWAALAFLFWKKGLYRRFPATSAYLTLRAVSTVLLLAVLRAAALPWGRSHHFIDVYFYGYFTMYLVNALLLYFICIEVFRSALAAFPGILKIAIVVFRWAAAVAVIVSLTSLPHANNIPSMISNISYYGLMRSVSVLELCLLAFLGLSMNALRMSVRDMAFGIALSFGIMSAGDFILSLWGSHITSANDPVQFVFESLLLAALGVWLVYCFLPKPTPRPVVMPATRPSTGGTRSPQRWATREQKSPCSSPRTTSSSPTWNAL